MRAYTVATAAVALGVQPKWVDNVLSHHAIPGVTQIRQGIARRLTREAVGVLEVALRLTREFGIPLRHALQMAASLQPGRDGMSRYQAGAFEMTVDTAAIGSEVDRRLAEAVEFTPTPRRGRPRGIKK